MFVDNDGKLRFDTYGINEVHSSATVRTGAWVHVAVTYDGTTYRLYVDGVADGVKEFGGGNESNGSWTFSIGASLNTGFPGGAFQGHIDEVGFWNRLLSATDVATVATSGLAGGTADVTTAGGSTAYSSNVGTGTITVSAVADEPTLAAIAVSGTEDTTLTFTAENFTGAYNDPESTALVSITVVTLPATGTLKLSTVNVTAGQVITAANLPNLTYVPAANENGTKTFTVTASDGALSSATATVTMTLAAVNDAPSFIAMTGTGGTVATVGIYKTHTFTTSGTFTPSASGPVEVLLVGGGGGGGPSLGGGGGGGGVIAIPAATVSSGVGYAVVVGAGGASATNGQASTIFGATAAGGGTSGGHADGSGAAGGSGGGAASNNGTLNQGGLSAGNSLGANTGTIYGNRGGHMTLVRAGDPTRAAGGGGAGGAALNTNSNLTGDTGQTGAGSGGVGVLNAILGTNFYWGGGGGGGAYASQNGGWGGLGGGGGGAGNGGSGTGGASALNAGANGGSGAAAGGAGGANTGGGGGGGSWSGQPGGAGGSGIVVIRYLLGGANYADTAANDTFAADSGTLSGADIDASTTLTYGIQSGTVANGLATKVGTYGTLAVTAATGAYTFTPNAAAISALVANTTETFTVTVSDGTATTTASYTVTITAVNDTPTVTAPASFALTEDVAGNLTYTGTPHLRSTRSSRVPSPSAYRSPP